MVVPYWSDLLSLHFAYRVAFSVALRIGSRDCFLLQVKEIT